jgi:hypothetical protein
MAWITPARVATLLRIELDNDEYIVELIAHLQALAEVHVGAQTEPISAGLAATFAEVAARKYQASLDSETNPTGTTQETIGSYSFTRTSMVGLLLTESEKKALRKAAGKTGLWVQPTTRDQDDDIDWVDRIADPVDQSIVWP